MSKSLWLARSWLFAMPSKMPRFLQTIYGNANICIGVLFNCDRTTFWIILFRLPKSCRNKNPYWPCAGLKVNFRKVSQEAASEASNKISCYQARKEMNSKIAFTECEDLKNSWSFPSMCQVQLRKNCPQCLAMFTNCSVNVNLMNCNVNVNANCKQ